MLLADAYLEKLNHHLIPKNSKKKKVSSAETFANSLDPDQAQQNVGLDLFPNCLTLYLVFLKEFLEKVDFEKSQQTTKHREKLPSKQRVKVSSAVSYRCFFCYFQSICHRETCQNSREIFIPMF